MLMFWLTDLDIWWRQAVVVVSAVEKSCLKDSRATRVLRRVTGPRGSKAYESAGSTG